MLKPHETTNQRTLSTPLSQGQTAKHREGCCEDRWFTTVRAAMYIFTWWILVLNGRYATVGSCFMVISVVDHGWGTSDYNEQQSTTLGEFSGRIAASLPEEVR